MVLLLMLVYSLALLGGLGASQIDLVQVLIVFADVEVVGQVDVVVIDVGVSLALLGELGASQIDLVQVAKKGFPIRHNAIILEGSTPYLLISLNNSNTKASKFNHCMPDQNPLLRLH